MVETGSIKLGTLFEYRDEDKLGNAVGDANEGKITEWSNDQWTKCSNEELNRLERKAVNIKKDLVGVQAGCPIRR